MSERRLGFQVDRPIVTLYGPFESHAHIAARFARADVKHQDTTYRVFALVPTAAERMVIGADPSGKPTGEELKEALAVFAIAELVQRPIKDLEPPAQAQSGVLAQIEAAVSPGPDSGTFESGMRYEGMWTIASIRAHPDLRGYDVSREGSTWTARPTS